MTEPRTLAERLLAWMRGEAEAFASFDEAALEVFHNQWERNIPYRNYCRSLGRGPAQVRSWHDIPALPTDAFKFPAHRPRGFPAERVVKRFLTSGTTREVRGCHEFERLDLYEASILGAWRNLGLPEASNPWFLSQSPLDAPESSLVHMFATLSGGREDFRWLINGTGSFETKALAREIGPVQVFSTALALLRLMEGGRPLPLAAGSWIFETGGYKGLTETLEPDEFRERVGEFFEVPPDRILNEYSMTELSSQFYRWPNEPGHQGPPWTRVRVIDPETGGSAPEGEPGYLEIIDLANLGSVMAVRTQDIAVRLGDSSFTLLGRDPGALPRGCSRAADDLLKSR